MINYLQQRIEPKEFGGLVVAIIFATVAAVFAGNKFISDDWDKKERKIKLLKKENNFTSGQRSLLAITENPAEMRSETERIKKQLEKLGISLEDETSIANRKNLSGAEAELKAAAVFRLCERSGLAILKASRTGSDQERIIEAEGGFPNLMKALKGLHKMDIGVSNIDVRRKAESDILLDINVSIAL